MNTFTDGQLLRLESRLLPFGLEWAEHAGRPLRAVNDGLDFLSYMAPRDDFWTALSAPASGDPYPVNLGELRTVVSASLPRGAATSEDRLRAMGLSEEEVDAIRRGIDEPDGADEAIREAFAAGSSQNIARALEHILETRPEVLAVQRSVQRLAEFRGLAHSVGALLGVVLLLVGTGCSPSTTDVPSSAASAVPQTTSAPTSTTSTNTSSAPAPSNSASASNSASPSSSTGPTNSSGSSPSQPSPPAWKPPPRPPGTRRPVTRYKGVSPRRYATAFSERRTAPR